MGKGRTMTMTSSRTKTKKKMGMGTGLSRKRVISMHVPGEHMTTHLSVGLFAEGHIYSLVRM